MAQADGSGRYQDDKLQSMQTEAQVGRQKQAEAGRSRQKSRKQAERGTRTAGLPGQPARDDV